MANHTRNRDRPADGKASAAGVPGAAVTGPPEAPEIDVPPLRDKGDKGVEKEDEIRRDFHDSCEMAHMAWRHMLMTCWDSRTLREMITALKDLQTTHRVAAGMDADGGGKTDLATKKSATGCEIYAI